MLVLLSDARLLLFDMTAALSSDGKELMKAGGKTKRARGGNEAVELEPDRELEVLGGCRPSCVVHPPTYVNKVVVGGRGAKMQLWNVSSGEIVHTLRSGPEAGVVSLEAAPALDVIAAGTETGDVHLINLRRDVVLFTLGCGPGAALSMSFSKLGAPRLAVGSARGGICVWDLEARRLACRVPEAHRGEELRCVEYVEDARGAMLLTCGSDNAIRTWRAERGTGKASGTSTSGAAVGAGSERLILVSERSGHVHAPVGVQFCGDRTILSAGGEGGADAMRIDSVVQDHRASSLSQKRLSTGDHHHHLSRVVSTAVCTLRSKDWCDAVTCHEGRRSAVMWRLNHARVGEHELVPPGGAAVTAVALSACGNFAVVGTETGAVHRFNMQSGLYRGEYRVKPSAVSSSSPPSTFASGFGFRSASSVAGVDDTRHASAIEALGVDGGNRRMLSACAGGLAGIWDFKARKPVAFLRLGSPVSRSAMHGASGLAALALAGTASGFALVVLDVGAARVVRRLAGHRDRVTGLEWSPDARLLLSSSMDGSVRVWDVPASRCLQVMRTSPPATSIALSPTADLMASTHVGCRGVYIWRNMRLFGDAEADADRDVAAPSYEVDLPNVRADARRRDGDGDGDGDASDAEEDDIEAGAGGVGLRRFESDDDDDDDDGDDGDDDDACDDDDLGKAKDADVDGDDWANGWRSAGAAGDLTLSTVAGDAIQAMLQPDLVRARNKPIDAPKKPEAAPFFLPTAPALGGRVKFALSTTANGDTGADDDDGTTKAEAATAHAGPGSLAAIVEAAVEAGEAADAHVSAVVALVRASPAPTLDAELTLIGLGVDDAAADAQLLWLLSVVGCALRRGSEADLMHSFLAMLLSSHAEAIARSAALRAAAVELHALVQRAITNLGDVVAEVRNMLDLIQTRM